MAREMIPYFNASVDGFGMEGLISYASRITDNWMPALFLLVFYALSIYVGSKGKYSMGGIVSFSSLLFFILSWIMQAITPINQIVIFIFFIGIIVGIAMTFIESAK